MIASRIYNQLVCVCSLFLILGRAGEAESATNVLPGVVFYPPSASLPGRLTFLISKDNEAPNSMSAASIYSLDLTTHALSKITEAPMGRFFVERKGDVCGVVFWEGIWTQLNSTNVFIFSQEDNRKDTFPLDTPVPGMIVVLEGHAFFEIYMWQTKILDYDAKTGKREYLVLPR